MKERKRIYKDCERAMYIPLFFNSVNEILSGILIIYTAGIIGDFADAVLKMDISYVKYNFYQLLFCILINVIIIPSMGFLCNVFMLKGALSHDRIVYSRFLDKKYENAMQMKEGEVQYRLENDPIEFRYYWMEIVTKCILIPILLIYLGWCTIRIHVIFTLFTFGISLIKLILPILFQKLLAKYDKASREYSTGVRNIEIEISDRPYAIAILHLKKAFLERLELKFQRFFDKIEKKNIKLRTIINHISTILDTIDNLLILLVGSILVANKVISTGVVVSMIGYITMFDYILNNINFLIENIPIMKNLLERLEVLYQDQEEEGGKEFLGKEANISAKQLSFSYGNKVIIDHKNFSIPFHSKTALFGENGSGKSTIIKILTGLIQDYKGEIQINQENLRNISKKSWREKIAFATQDSYIFEGTLEENIRLGNLEANDQEINEIIKEIGLEYLKNRKISMEDVSGGERQRISIARALIKESIVLILDEPNNNLDKEGIQWLQTLIKKSDKMIIFVSHEKEMLSCANNIIQL